MYEPFRGRVFFKCHGLLPGRLFRVKKIALDYYQINLSYYSEILLKKGFERSIHTFSQVLVIQNKAFQVRNPHPTSLIYSKT